MDVSVLPASLLLAPVAVPAYCYPSRLSQLALIGGRYRMLCPFLREKLFLVCFLVKGANAYVLNILRSTTHELGTCICNLLLEKKTLQRIGWVRICD